MNCCYDACFEVKDFLCKFNWVYSDSDVDVKFCDENNGRLKSTLRSACSIKIKKK